MERMTDYKKVGLLVLEESKILLCRKRGLTSKLILPGGCVEKKESLLKCLLREVDEELGNVTLDNLRFIGIYQDIAASEDPTATNLVEITLFKGGITGEAKASSEITELVWFGEDSNKSELTPILINKIIPDLIKRGVLNWKN